MPRGSVTWTRDPIRDLESRSQVYLGPGFHVWDDSKRTLNISIGPNYLVEDIGIEKEDSLAVQTVFRYEQRFLDDDLVVFQQTDYQSVVTGRKNKILNTSTGIRWELPRDVYINMQVDYDHETNPAEGREGEDVTYLGDASKGGGDELLSQKAVQSVMRSNFSKLTGCVQQEWRRNRGLRGVNIDFGVQGSGQVSEDRK